MLHRALTLSLSLFALPAALPAAGIPVTGRVLGPEGEPRPEAEVVLEAIPPSYERARLRLAGRAGPDRVDRARTGADGTFALAAPDTGMWKVVVTAPGALTMEFRLVPLAEAAALPPLELMPSADLEVRMVDIEGRPRPGRIGAYTLGIRGDVWRPRLRLARAGEDGVARLPLGRDEKIQLELLADAHPLLVYTLFDESSVTIEVPAGVAGTVRITDQLKRPRGEAVAFQGSALVPLGLSDEEGRLSVVLAAEEPPALQVMTADLWNGSFELDLAGGGEVKDLRLDPPAMLRGRVLDLSNRDPVAGALVWAVRGQLAVTDERGRYELPIGIYKSRWVQALAAGYLAGNSQVRDASEETSIALAPAGALAGRVVDEDGDALDGVAVELSIPPNRGQLSMAAQRLMRDGWRGRTSSRGAFRLTGLPAGIAYRLTFEAAGFAPLTLDVEALEALESRSGIEAVLYPGRVAAGTVVDEGDAPVVGAEVRLEAPPPTDDLTAAMMRSFDEEAREPAHLTDAEGRFEIADLAAGRYDLEVRAAGYAPAKVSGVRVDEGGGRVDFGTVVLAPGASVEGRVTDPDGTALAGAEVTVETGRQGFMGMSRGSGPRGRAETDAEGRFVVSDLAPGQSVVVAVSKKGYGSEAVADVRPPTEEPVAVVLRLAGRLGGRVSDPRGDPIRSATVMAHPDPQAMNPAAAASMALARKRRPTWARTGADGRFLIEDVEPGTLRVTADADSYQQQVRSGVEVAPGKEHELDFVLETGAVVVGTLTTADGEPVAQAWINVTQRSEGGFGGTVVRGSDNGQTDVEGRYRLEGVPIGSASITVFHAERQHLEKSIDVRPGTNVVDLVLERGFEVSGQVVEEAGAPMAGAAVSIQEAGPPGAIHFSSGPAQAVSGADGTFTLTGVGAGKYALTASREGYARASSEAFEVAGDVAGLLLELRRGAILKGRVVGLESGELGALGLTAFSQQGVMRRGRVDFSGEYAFDSLTPGRWHVTAQVAGSGRMSTMQVEVPEGVAEVERDIEFGIGFTLAGVVLDGGQPLAGAQVTAASEDSMGQGTTGTDGRFRIENLKVGSCRVMVMSGMGLQHTEVVELAGDHEMRIEISTGSVAGTVRDADGEPLAGAALSLEELDAGDDVLPWQFAFGGQVRSDSLGHFLVQRVRRGTWRVVATKPGYAPGEAAAVVAGGGAAQIEIRMSPTEGVTFGIALESGAALSSVQVAILAPSGRRLAHGIQPVIDGKVRVSTVPPGRWDLVIQGGDSAATRVAVDAPGEAGRFVLPAGGTLHIKVPELERELTTSVVLTDPDGRPFVSALGIAFPPGEWMMAGGQAMVPSLVPGLWSFTVKHRDGRTWSGSATVTAGATTEVSLP